MATEPRSEALPIGEWHCIAETAASEIPTTRWVVRNLLLAGAITILSGNAGKGKSVMAWTIAVLVSLGIKWGPWEAPVARRRVLILSAEDDFDEIQRCMAVICNEIGVSRSEVSGWVHVYNHLKIKLVRRQAGVISVTELWESLRQRIEEWDVGLLVIAPYNMASSGLDELSDNDMVEFQGLVRQLVIKSDCAVLMLDRQRKAYGIAWDTERGGSSKIYDARVACSASLATEAEHKTMKLPGNYSRYVKFRVFKSNYGEMTDDIWFELKPRPVGNGEMRPALRHVTFTAHDGEWEHHEAFIKMVRAGRQDEGHHGWPWSATTLGRKAGRLEEAVQTEFNVLAKEARAWIAKYEEKGLIVKQDWVAPTRNKQKVWALDEQKVNDDGPKDLPRGGRGYAGASACDL